MLTVAEEDRLGAGMLKVDLLPDEDVATAEENPPIDVVVDNLDPASNPPQLLPAQERP